MKFQRTTGDQPAAGAELVPDGEHDVQIVAVKEWSRDGREALIVTLQPVDPRYAQVEKWLDPSNDRDAPLVTQLADVLGIAGDEFELDDTIVGHRVRIVAKNGIRKKDNTATVYVNAFLEPKPAPQWQQQEDHPLTTPPKSVAKRTALQKAKAAAAQAGEDDGIPF